MAMDQSKIRNFCIIAHIDHGKSTLADRIIEMTGLHQERDAGAGAGQHGTERERGITIKSRQSVPFIVQKTGRNIFLTRSIPGTRRL